LGDLSEASREESERVRADIPVPRQLPVLANLVAARRAVLAFARQHRNPDLLPTRVSVAYRTDGKPELRFDDASITHAFAGIDVSLADGAGISVALIGPAPVGVDIESVEARDAETWRGLLGDDGYSLALRLTVETAEPFDCAATRVWTLLEAGKKATGPKKLIPRYEAPLGGPWLSCVGAEDAGMMDFLCVTLSSFGKAVATAALTVTMGTPDMPGEGDAAEHRTAMV